MQDKPLDPEYQNILFHMAGCKLSQKVLWMEKYLTQSVCLGLVVAC